MQKDWQVIPANPFVYLQYFSDCVIVLAEVQLCIYRNQARCISKQYMY